MTMDALASKSAPSSYSTKPGGYWATARANGLIYWLRNIKAQITIGYLLATTTSTRRGSLRRQAPLPQVTAPCILPCLHRYDERKAYNLILDMTVRDFYSRLKIQKTIEYQTFRAVPSIHLNTITNSRPSHWRSSKQRFDVVFCIKTHD